MESFAESSALFNYTVFGWTITNSPPKITAKGDYPPSPAGIVLQQTVDSGTIPYQTIDVSNQTSNNVSSINKWQVDDKPDYFLIYNSTDPGLEQGSMNLFLNIPTLSDLTNVVISLVFQSETEDGSDGYIFSVNGAPLDNNTVTDNLTWQTKNYPVPTNMLRQGENSISIQTNSQAENCEILIKSISLKSGVYVTASSLWNQIDLGEVDPGDSYTASASYNYGVTASASETQTFAESIGLGVSATLKDIGINLSAHFSKSSGTTHSISLTEETSDTYSTTFNAPSDHTLTYQIWQLSYLFESIGSSMLLGLGGTDQNLIIPRQFPNS